MTDHYSSYPGAPGNGAAGNAFNRDDVSLLEVVGHYDSFFKVGLTDDEKRELIEGLLGPRADSDSAHKSQRKSSLINPGGWS